MFPRGTSPAQSLAFARGRRSDFVQAIGSVMATVVKLDLLICR